MRRKPYPLKSPPDTLESLNALIGEAYGIGITQEDLKRYLWMAGYSSLRSMPPHEYRRFAGLIQGGITWRKGLQEVDNLVAYANGEYDPRTSKRLERRSEVTRSELIPTEEKPMSAITMTIEANFGTVPEWMEFLKMISILGFAGNKGHEHAHGLIGKAHHAPEHGHHGEHHGHKPEHHAETAGEQNVNALDHGHEHKAEEKPAARKGRPPKAEKALTKDDINELVGKAKEAGLTPLQIGQVIRALGHDGFANVPVSEYGKLAELLHDAISTAKASVL